ncbi:MAG: trehalase family glycosidase [Clostridiales bacterium]|nr:trehalase family glycosidase [Clostridiales bacterium]
MLPHTRVEFHTQDEQLQRLYNTAVQKCRNNLNTFAGDQVLVEGGGYEKIWLETQPMGGEMYAKHNMTAALNNHLLFMRHQREDGRLAGSIQGFPDGTVEAQFNKFQGFCFPWSALNMYYWIGEDRQYLDQLADCLERFDAYLWAVRDSNGDGILESWCKYDTGEDNAVRYGDAPNYAIGEVPPEGSSVVPMASMDVMSFSYACRDTLSEIGLIRGDMAAAKKWRAAADEVANTIGQELWDDARGALFDKDKHGHVIDVLCHNTLRCMYWGSVSPYMADRFVKEHLLNPEEFWTPCPLPSVAANDPAFRNAVENNWSGQCEGLTYQRAILALERYGYEKLVTQLGKKLFDVVSKGGLLFVQQFDPLTGAPSIVDPETKEPLPPDTDKEFQDSYGPTLLSVLEYIAHIWGVTMVRGQIWFSLGSGSPYTYEQVWGEHRYRVDSDGKTARAFADGREVYCGECSVRLVTTRDGKILYKVEIE